jgi:predicted acyltransferase
MTTTTSPSPVPQRLMSLDALRGFDMFWIIGAESLVEALHRLTPSGPTTVLATQRRHVGWAGFHFEDLIFPLFVFMMGVAMVFSLTKTVEREGRARAVKRVLRRGVLLFVVGIFYSGGFREAWPDMRLMGVLNRIALAYLFAGLLFCFFKPRALVAICVGLLVGYWALLSFIPMRDIRLTQDNLARMAEAAGDAQTAAYYRNGDSPNPSEVKNSPVWAATQNLFNATTNRVTGKFEQGYNVCDHFDFQYLPGRKYDTFFDPEGFLSTLPAIATCLLGVFAGLVLKNTGLSDLRKVAWLVGAGILSVGLGWLWDYQFPVIKKIWTSSYVLVAGGYSAMLLGGFYLVVDVWKRQTWCQPFVWIGMNSITIYMAGNILGGFERLAERLAGGDIKTYLNAHVAKGFGDLLVSIVGLLLAFWLVRFLYQRKVFLRL